LGRKRIKNRPCERGGDGQTNVLRGTPLWKLKKPKKKGGKKKKSPGNNPPERDSTTTSMKEARKRGKGEKKKKKTGFFVDGGRRFRFQVGGFTARETGFSDGSKKRKGGEKEFF